MPFVKRKSLLTLSILSGVALVATAGFVWSGIYNIGADDMHTKPGYGVLQVLREKSIEHHARDLQVPDLTDAASIRSGAGNYAAMCTGCHLAPGMDGTELSRGLYPSPPNLSQADVKDPAHHFWVIKHGIKASGMPAWGKSMGDEYIWNMVAFLQQLPKLSPEQYHAIVDSSGGHSHGGGETEPHDDAGAVPGHDEMAGMEMGDMHTDESKPHVDAPGAHDKKPAANQNKSHVDPPGTPAHEHKPSADKSKPHTDPPGAPPHGH